jgi:endonuclease V-like protein UPF0215 family
MVRKPASKRFSNVIGFDDAPFPVGWVGNVKVVGTVYAKLRLNGVLIGEVEKDGLDAAENLAALVAQSKFGPSTQLVMLQGIALAGFNVVDVFHLHRELQIPVVVVSRKPPNMEAIREALLTKVRGGKEKWGVIERLGPMEPVGHVYVQCLGVTVEQVATVVREFTVDGRIPEPLRTAHLIAGAIVDGQSRGRT